MIDTLIGQIEKANQVLLYFGGMVFVILLPFSLARFTLQLTLVSGLALIHWMALAVFFGVLAFWAWLISGDRARRLFIASYAQGIKWPVLYSVALLTFSLPIFASLTISLSQLGLVSFNPVIPNDDTAIARVQDFYLWHFLDSIPGLDIPKTVRWDAPYTYKDRLSGWILLAFKLTVILPVIGSFAVWHQVRKEKRVRG